MDANYSVSDCPELSDGERSSGKLEILYVSDAYAILRDKTTNDIFPDDYILHDRVKNYLVGYAVSLGTLVSRARACNISNEVILQVIKTHTGAKG